MSDDAARLSNPPPSVALRLQGTSKLAFAATTIAMVALASTGTGLLVSHGTKDDPSAPTARPQGVVPGTEQRDLVVPRPPGTLVALPPRTTTSGPDASPQGILEALSRRQARTITLRPPPPVRGPVARPGVPLRPTPPLSPVTPPVTDPTTVPPRVPPTPGQTDGDKQADKAAERAERRRAKEQRQDDREAERKAQRKARASKANNGLALGHLGR